MPSCHRQAGGNVAGVAANGSAAPSAGVAVKPGLVGAMSRAAPARRASRGNPCRRLPAWLASLAILAVPGGRPAAAAGGLDGIPRFSHIVLLVLENESFATSWGSGSAATYLNGLRAQGVLADHYYATSHHSLGNYVAMVSGQPVQPATAGDCEALNLYDCAQGQTAMAGGRNLADQIEDAGLNWKGYMDTMPGPCFHAD